MKNRCEDCKWWDSSTKSAMDDQDVTGLCRVKPPVADKRNGIGRWPFTEDTDWCGSFAAKEAEDE